MWLLPVLVVVASLFVWLSSGRFVSTDNAYVKGDRAAIATELSGIIVEVPVQENQHVSRGQLLFKLDDQTYRLALSKIEAEIETARADIRGLRAQWRTKREEIKAAESQRNFATAEFDRQSDLAEKKIASMQKLQETRMGLDVARQRISAAEEDLLRIEAALAGDPKISPDDHPKSSSCWRRATRRCCSCAAPPSIRRSTASSPSGRCRAVTPPPASRSWAGGGRHRPVDRGELQGDRAHAGAHGPGGDDQGRHLSRLRLQRQGRQHRPGDRCGVRRAAAAERLGQLGEGGAAHPGARFRDLPRGRSAVARRHEHDGRDRHRLQSLAGRPC